MQILLVANGNYKFHGKRYYGVERLVHNGLVRNGHNVYFFSDRDVARASNIIGSSRWGAGRCNEIFLDTCRNLEPDFILFGHADLLSVASLKAARQLLPHVKMAQFNVDPMFRPQNVAAIAAKAPLMDATFVTTAGAVLQRFAGAGGPVTYMPNPVDSSVHYPRCFERSDQLYDLFFAARPIAAPVEDDPRAEIPAFIAASQRVAIDYHGVNGRPQLYGRAHFRHIENARMGLNISSVRESPEDPYGTAEELYLYSSDRIAHYLGSGLLVFTTRDNRLEDLFVENVEMIFFHDKHDLLEKLLYFKSHDGERQSIARAGWQKAHAHFNERLVAKYMIETTFQFPLSESYAWPTAHY
jgi:hypothetical protein